MTPMLGRIVEEYSEGTNRIGVVEFEARGAGERRRRPVYLFLVPDAHTGDYVRFHAGFATERVVASESATSAGGAREPDMETLQSCELLSELEPQQLRRLLPFAQEKSFEPGQIIFHEGEKSLYLHLIVSGEVAIEEASGDHPVYVQTLRPGDAMGWSALSGDGRAHFQARALSPVSTVAFDGDEIRAACDRDPVMGYAFVRRLVNLVAERLDAVRLKLASRG